MSALQVKRLVRKNRVESMSIAMIYEKETQSEYGDGTEVAKDFADVFPEKLSPGLPLNRGIEHQISLSEGAKDIRREGMRKHSQPELEEMRKQIEELLKQGFIRPSSSVFGFPIVFVRNKDGTQRMCVDYRMLNKLKVEFQLL